MSKKATGLKSIAYEVGLSINTVSRALRDCDDISESTKELVRKKAIELGYLPNTLSQFLKRDCRLLIAIILGVLDNYYFVVGVKKLIAALSAQDVDYTVIVTSNDVESDEVIKQCISQRVDAIISLTSLDKKAIEIAKFNNLPLTVFGNDIDYEFIDSVYPDSEAASNIVANYLLNYHKTTKLVYVDLEDAIASTKRKNDFIKDVTQIDPSAEVIVVERRKVKEQLPELIRKGYLGIFCFNDQTAYDVLDQLNKVLPNVRRIYPKLHLVGFDAISQHLVGLQDITSIDYDYDLLAEKTVASIIKRVENPNKPQEKIIVETSLHQRKLH